MLGEYFGKLLFVVSTETAGILLTLYHMRQCLKGGRSASWLCCRVPQKPASPSPTFCDCRLLWS